LTKKHMDAIHGFPSTISTSLPSDSPGDDKATLLEFSRLMDTVEQQQRWIHLLCTRFLETLTISAEEREVRKSEDAEILKLEASVNVMSKLSLEMAEKLKYITKFHGEQKRKSEGALEILQEELREVQGERITAEVEAQRHLSTLERSFEKIVEEKENELSELRQAYREATHQVDDLKHRLEIQTSTLKGFQGRDAGKNASENNFVLPLLHALWQVTSEPVQASNALQGSPKLLESICKKMESWKLEILEKPVKVLSAPLGPIEKEIWSTLPSICGILVNIASTTDGRRDIIRTSRGGLLTQILRMTEWIQQDVSPYYQKEVEREEEGTFQRDFHSSSQHLFDTISSTSELLLCIVSNVCADKIPALKMIEAGLFNILKIVILSEKKESLRRYASGIVKSTMGYISEFTPTNVNHHLNRDGMTSNSLFLQIGDIISCLSKDRSLKIVGLDLLGELQRIMPMED